MFKRVIVPLDGSEFSEAILGPARDLCETADARITLLRVADLEDGDGGGAFPAAAPGAAVAREAQESVDQRLARVEDEVRTYLEEKARVLSGAGAKVETEVLISDDVPKAIIDYAKESDADLIMMSTHCRTGIASVASRNVSQKVMRATRRPVLLICPPGC